MDSKTAAAKQYAAYNKSNFIVFKYLHIELSLGDKVVNDKYLGAIFTK
jgi:hypothetical protein